MNVDDLAALAVLVVTSLPLSPLRLMLGVPLTLFFLGYVAMAALVPGSGRFGGPERSIPSFSISTAIVPLIGFAPDFLP